MKKPLVSIIIPVYKVEKYICRCLESIRNQTFTDFEVLLVNDGTPDKSAEICEEYASWDNRFRVFHKENGGVSSARNVGLQNAVGEWITFVDADDYIHKDCISICVDNIAKYNADVLQFGLMQVNESYEVLSVVKEKINPCNPSQYYRKVKRALCAGGVIIRNSIIKENRIAFIEDLKLGEDLLFLIECMSHSTKIQHIPNELYYYLERASGSSLLLTNVDQIKKQIHYSLNYRKRYVDAKSIIDNQLIARMCDLLQISSEYDDYLRSVFCQCGVLSNKLTFKRFLFVCCARVNFGFACKFSRFITKRN